MVKSPSKVRWEKRRLEGTCYICFQPHIGIKKGCDSCLQKRRESPSPSRSAVASRAHNKALKIEAFEAYGGKFCTCCGEQEIRFLSLDHVNNDGSKHQTTPGRRGVRYHQLKAAGWPNNPPLQVLCMNCNFGKKINGGICPHKSL